MPILLILTFLMSSSFATVTVENVDCPEQFEGRVQDVIDDLGPSHSYERQTVTFKNLQTVKGSVEDQVSIPVLKHGPFQFKAGEDYLVQLRSGKVCWVEKL